MTLEQFDTLTRAIREHPEAGFAPWFEPVLRLYWATGCRPAEIVGRSERQRREPEEGMAAQTHIKEHHGVRARDVLGANALFVEGKNTNGGRGRADALKGRTVTVTDRATYRDLVARVGAAVDPEANLYGLGPNPEAPNWDGYWQLQRQIRKLRRFLPDSLRLFEVRWLRHSWAIHALRSGVDLVSIQRQLGHEKLEVTAIYLRFFPTDTDGLIDKFSVGQDPFEKRDCPACGFAWGVDRKTGQMALNARMDSTLIRRRLPLGAARSQPVYPLP